MADRRQESRTGSAVVGRRGSVAAAGQMGSVAAVAERTGSAAAVAAVRTGSAAAVAAERVLLLLRLLLNERILLLLLLLSFHGLFFCCLASNLFGIVNSKERGKLRAVALAMQQNGVAGIGSLIACVQEAFVALLVGGHPVDGTDGEAVGYGDDAQFVFARTLAVDGDGGARCALVERVLESILQLVGKTFQVAPADTDVFVVGKRPENLVGMVAVFGGALPQKAGRLFV